MKCKIFIRNFLKDNASSRTLQRHGKRSETRGSLRFEEMLHLNNHSFGFLVSAWTSSRQMKCFKRKNAEAQEMWKNTFLVNNWSKQLPFSTETSNSDQKKLVLCQKGSIPNSTTKMMLMSTILEDCFQYFEIKKTGERRTFGNVWFPLALMKS